MLFKNLVNFRKKKNGPVFQSQGQRASENRWERTFTFHNIP